MTTPILPQALAKLQERAAEGLRTFVSAEERAERTLAAKAAAEALVEARPYFTGRDGAPDLLGKSADYRTFVTEAQEMAGVPRADRASVQAAIRYHISPLLRAKHGAEVEKLGLAAGSSVERGRRRKERDARVVALFAGGSELLDTASISDAANLSRLAVSRVSGWPSGTPKGTRERIRAEYANLLAAVEAAIERLS